VEQTDDSQAPRWPNSHPTASPSYTTLRDSTHLSRAQHGTAVSADQPRGIPARLPEVRQAIGDLPMPPFGNRLPEVEVLGSGFTDTELGYANLEKAGLPGPS